MAGLGPLLLLLLSVAGVGLGSSVRAGWSSSGSSLSQSAQMLLVGKPRGFVRVSESHYDHAHHTHNAHPRLEPRLAAAVTNTSVQAFLGDTAALDCTVHDLANQSVSWMRQQGDSLTLLTWDSHTYLKDHRYRLVQEEGVDWQRWRLVIEAVRGGDGGRYRCQVATVPPLVLHTSLTVLEPRARVVEERGRDVSEKHYNSGSRIELRCIVDHVSFPHRNVTWRRGSTLLSFNTSRGGISVKGDARDGFLSSRLYVTDASPSDSGVYSCWYHNYTSASVSVHVIAGENWAGLHHDSTSASPPPASSLPFLAVIAALATSLTHILAPHPTPTLSPHRYIVNIG